MTDDPKPPPGHSGSSQPPVLLRVRSQTPDRDDEFFEEMPFPAVTTVKAGDFAERTFGFGRPCSVRGILLRQGLTLVRVVCRVGSRFFVRREEGQRFVSYDGVDALVYGDGETFAEGLRGLVRDGKWKRVRLGAGDHSGLYLTVRNDTDDDLHFDGILRLVSNPVPSPGLQET